MKLRLTLGLAASLLFLALPVVGQQTQMTQMTAPEKKDEPAPPHKLGPLDFYVSWRDRAEGWDWFKGPAGDGNYTFGHDMLKLAIGQRGEHFDWYLEGAEVAIVGLPSLAVVPAPQGQLGLGGNYFAANNGSTNNIDGFLKQGFIRLKDYSSTFTIGRFEYFDGNEVKPKDPTVATLVQTALRSV